MEGAPANKLFRLHQKNKEVIPLNETRICSVTLETITKEGIDLHTNLRDKVNETTIRRMYDEQAGLRDRGVEIQARHILVKTEEVANSIVAKLADGADFKALAKEFSEDEGSRAKGGDL